MRGDPDHPVTRGVLCAKVDRYLERTYHPQRLTRPLRRTGPKGSGAFRPISWDEALDEIARRLEEIIRTEGGEAILPYSYAGTMGLVQSQSMDRRFFNRLGASHLLRTICSEAGFRGLLYTLGTARGIAPEDFARARYIILWGANLLTSNLHLWPFVREAQRQGAKIVVIDPVRTKTARQADWWIPIRPGTDAALALALMHVIFAEGLEDRDYLARYCVGAEPLRARVRDWPPERAAEITGVAPEEIRRLAREYASTRPAAIRLSYGMQRHGGGGMATRAIACLPAVIGAWRDVGGGLLLSTSGAFPLNYEALERPDLRPYEPRSINMIELGRALTEVDDPPVRALIVYNSNPAAVAPDQAAVRRGLAREDLFTVVLEHFQTDTADYADIVLPATTQLEHWDLLKPYGHYYLALNRPAIAPIGESKPNSEIFRLLAQRMGFTEPCFQDDDLTLIRQALDSPAPELKGITLERLLQEGHVRLNLPEPYAPFAAGGFPTPSGKCELYSQQLADLGYDPLPTYTPPHWAEQTTTNDELLLVSPPAHYFLNSTFVNVDRLREREGEPTLFIHPDDAMSRGVEDGMWVEVFNARGAFQARARVRAEVRPGVCASPSVWWPKLSPDRRNVNFVTSQAVADMGGGATFHDCVVRLRPIEAPPATEGAST
ncbi:MAG: molybdopterin oxidoreductase family protein [Anaerolineae bacterium]